MFGTQDGTVLVVDEETGHELHTLRSHRGFVRAIDASHQMLISASGAADGELMLWNARSGKCARKLEGHGDGVYSVALNAAENRALT